MDKVKGTHYALKDGIEAMDIIEAISKRESIPREAIFCVGNALKYILRAGKKPGESWKEDLAKAENYCHRAITGEWSNGCKG